MMNKLFIIAFVLTLAVISTTAQTEKGEKPPTAAAFSFTFGGNSGYIGIQSAEITKENFGEYGLSGVRGVAVKEVVEGSPAQKAGLLAGDVITAINGESVTGTRKLTRLISEIAPDHTALITILRNGVERQLDVTVGKHPMSRLSTSSFPLTLSPSGKLGESFFKNNGEGGIMKYFSGISGRRIGISTTSLTDQLSRHFNVEGGLLVSRVGEGSPAEKAGLVAGDIIIRADGKNITSEGELIKIINQKREGAIELTIVRGGMERQISITPEKSGLGLENLLERHRLQESGDSPAPFRIRTFPGRII